MKKIISILLYISLVSVLCAFSGEIEIDSEVINVNPDLEFFIVASGEGDGIELGDGLIVHRGAEKIAEAYIIEVRPDVSAAEVLDVEEDEEIQEGDSVLIVKRTEEEPGEAYRAPGKSRPAQKTAARPGPKWATLIGRDSGAPASSSYTPAVPARVTPAGPGANIISRSRSEHLTRPTVVDQGDIISIDVSRDAKAVFSYARLSLRESGYSVISSNRAAGILVATKPIALSLMKELWADAFAAIDHRLVVSLDVKDEGSGSKVIVSSFREHSQKGHQVTRGVTRNSKYYNELVNLLSRIKQRSEYSGY